MKGFFAIVTVKSYAMFRKRINVIYTIVQEY